jgi:Spy/CpxP family protein refolding chaperone
MKSLKQTIESFRAKGRGKKAFWILLILAVVLVTASGFSKRNERGDRGHRGHQRQGKSVAELRETMTKHPKWLKRAGLTEEQISGIEAILEGVEPALVDLEIRAESIEYRISKALGAEVVDAAALAGLRRESSTAALEAFETGFDSMVAIAELLSAEQRAAALSHWQKKS